MLDLVLAGGVTDAVKRGGFPNRSGRFSIRSVVTRVPLIHTVILGRGFDLRGFGTCDLLPRTNRGS